MESKTNYKLNQIPDTDEVSTSQIFDIEYLNFKPHFGNNCLFMFKKDEPLITIGPHFGFSVVLSLIISYLSFYISFRVIHKKSMILQILSVASGLNLLTMLFITILKNPGLNIAFSHQEIKEGFCKTCRVFKEKGTVHCLDCDICVRGHDHHCPWIGKCVGEGNIKYFQLFLCSFLAYFFINLFVLVI